MERRTCLQFNVSLDVMRGLTDVFKILAKETTMSTDITTIPQPQLHIRYDGRSIDVEQARLDVGLATPDATIRSRVAEHLGVPVEKLQQFEIDRNTNTGDMTMRPHAVFGAS